MISKRLIALGIANPPFEKFIEPLMGEVVGIELGYREIYLGILSAIESQYANGEMHNQYEIIIDKQNIRHFHSSVRKELGGKFRVGNTISLSLNHKKIDVVVKELEWKYPKDMAKLTVCYKI